MTATLDNRVAMHALLASAASPQQLGGLFILGVPGDATRYFWRELKRHGDLLIDAAATDIDEGLHRIVFRNQAVVLVLPNGNAIPWDGLGRIDGVVFYGRTLDESLVTWARDNLVVEPKGWVLVA